MSYYLIISFVIFIIVDYRYIYELIDSTILYSRSGSKLDYETNNHNSIKEFFKEFATYNVIDIIIFFIIFFLLFVINYSISSIAFDINPLTINIFSKTLNLKIIFGDVWTKFVLIYHIASAIFMLIIILGNRLKIRFVLFKLLKNIIKSEEIEKIDSKPASFVIAKDENDECFELTEETLYKNLLITGSIGSGKTSGAISRICYNLIKSGKGGLILDVKGNFTNIVENICKKCGRYKDLKIISKDSKSYFELLDNKISCLELANRIKQVITLLSTVNNSDSYWLDKVENVLINVFILIDYMKLR